jgi:hypothetical protein
MTNNLKPTKMTHHPSKSKPYPISSIQLSFFAKELQDAGGFDELMLKKKAIERINGSTMIKKYEDIRRYKRIYINGIYKPLQPYFNTKVPYAFWSQLYLALKTNMGMNQKQ